MMDDAAMDRVVLERISLCVRTAISRDEWDATALDSMVDFAANNLVVVMSRSLAAARIGEATVRYPADWWQALKERWFPAWALERWPVRETVYDLEAHLTYPTVELPNRARGPIVYAVHRSAPLDWTI